MERHQQIGLAISTLVALLFGIGGFFLGRKLTPDWDLLPWILFFSGIALVAMISRGMWRSIKALGFRLSEGVDPNAAAIDRFEVELKENIKPGAQRATELRENPFEFKVILKDKWGLRPPELMMETGDRDLAERAHITVKNDLDEMLMMDFFERWIYNKSFDYLDMTPEQRQEYLRTLGRR